MTSTCISSKETDPSPPSASTQDRITAVNYKEIVDITRLLEGEQDVDENNIPETNLDGLITSTKSSAQSELIDASINSSCIDTELTTEQEVGVIDLTMMLDEETASESVGESRSIDSKTHPSSSNTRVRKRNQALRKIKALNVEVIQAQLYDDNCDVSCTSNCSDNFNMLQNGITLIYTWRQKYHRLPQGPKQQLALVNLVRTTRFKPEGQSYYRHLIEGNAVCRKFFYQVIIGVTYATYAKALKKAKGGVHWIENRHLGNTSGRGLKGAIAKGYMQNYVTRLGDPSPETNRILMPVCITIQQMYSEYALLYRDQALKPKRFYQIWNHHFKHVSFPKYCKVAGCDLCMLARNLISNETDPNIRQRLINDRDAHLKQQQSERDAYYDRRSSAVCNPQDKTSAIIDGMDQAKTNLPHYKGWKQPKSAGHSLRTHITGVIVHGKGTHFYLDLHQWPHDSNLMLNCLLDAICSYRDEENSLPPILYIQADNCGRENKNKYVIGMLSLLVKGGYIKEIILSFLMKGHTHEDIDQRFSKVSQALQRYDAKTVEELLEIMHHSLKSRPRATILTKVYDIRSWIACCLQPISNHSHPHVFRIFIDFDDHVAVQYKMWSTDEDWCPSSSHERLEIFNLLPNGKQQIPTGEPNTVAPDFKKQDFQELVKAIEAQRPHLKYDQYMSWKKLVENPNLQVNQIGNTYRGSSPDQWYLSLLSACHNKTVVTQPMGETPLALMRAKELKCPVVSAGKRKSISGANIPSNTQQPTVSAGAEDTEIQDVPAVGFMVVYNSKVRNRVQVGKVKSVMDDKIKIKCYTGKMYTKWKPYQKPNGKPKFLVIQAARIVYPFKLTSSLRLPALVVKKIVATKKRLQV